MAQNSVQISMYMQKSKCVVYYHLSFTFSRQCLSVGGGFHAKLFGRTEASAVEEYRQVDNVPHVVVAVDVGVSQHTIEVLVDSFYDNMGITGKDGDKRAFGEEYPHLEQERNITSV